MEDKQDQILEEITKLNKSVNRSFHSLFTGLIILLAVAYFLFK